MEDGGKRRVDTHHQRGFVNIFPTLTITTSTSSISTTDHTQYTAKMLINAVFVFFSVLGCALTSRANQLPLRSGATGATLSLWEGFDLTLPSQDSIDDFFAQAGDGISQAVDIGKQKVDGLRKSPVSTAATEIFDNAVKTSKEKLQDLGKSGVVADAGNWAVDATSNVAVLVDGAMTDFQASQLGFEALKLAAYVKEFGEDRVRDLKGVEVPESVLVWFAEARRDLDIAVTEFKEQEVPKAVLKWIEEHPTEMETAGWVLKNGVWLALTANPAMAWSPLLHVLGWGSKGPILGTSLRISRSR